MIDRDAEPIRNIPVRPRIDISHPGRRRVITRQEVEDNICREPDAAVYVFDMFGDAWVLKDEWDEFRTSYNFRRSGWPRR